jgi:peptidoglycan/LPS O-acetylase OafA/YrhL
VRNRYLDLLRAVAIVRVVVYHLFGWPWLSIVLPAMGVMFALAGSLTAASLDKRSAGAVVVSRLRRLLPPLWLLGLIAVPVMLALGWAHESDGTHPFSPAKLLLWVLPVTDPPGSDKGVDIWDPLWYIRAYLWFVLLSPVLYPVYKKIGWVVVAAPIVAIAVLDKTGFSLPDAADAAMWDFVTFGACWMAGFAHHDGRLARTRPAVVIGAAAVLGAVALYWLRGHPGEDGYDLNDVAESQALWSLAFVLVVLRWQPPMGWLARVPLLDKAVTLLNGRAVTIYLWHNIAIDAVWPVLTVLALDDIGRLTDPVELGTALAITGGAVLAFGWVEDLAARRRPRLLPITDAPRLRPDRDHHIGAGDRRASAEPHAGAPAGGGQWLLDGAGAGTGGGEPGLPATDAVRPDEPGVQFAPGAAGSGGGRSFGGEHGPTRPATAGMPQQRTEFGMPLDGVQMPPGRATMPPDRVQMPPGPVAMPPGRREMPPGRREMPPGGYPVQPGGFGQPGGYPVQPGAVGHPGGVVGRQGGSAGRPAEFGWWPVHGRTGDDPRPNGAVGWFGGDS